MKMTQQKTGRRRRRHRKWIVSIALVVAIALSVTVSFSSHWMLVYSSSSLDLKRSSSSSISSSMDIASTTTTATAAKRYAYVFYATTISYACGAFVNIAALQDSGTPQRTIDFVLLTYGLDDDPGISEQAAKLNVKLKPVEHLKTFRGRNGKSNKAYYSNVMFPNETTTTLLAAARVTTNYQNLDSKRDGYVYEENMYDMDLLNKEFRNDVTLLPGTYAALTAIWENNNNATAPDQEWYSKILTGDSPSLHVHNKENVTTKQELFEATHVLHFTPNKPMLERSLTHIRRAQPNADPRYYATFEHWFSLASYVCPFDDHDKTRHKYDAHKCKAVQALVKYIRCLTYSTKYFKVKCCDDKEGGGGHRHNFLNYIAYNMATFARGICSLAVSRLSRISLSLGVLAILLAFDGRRSSSLTLVQGCQSCLFSPFHHRLHQHQHHHHHHATFAIASRSTALQQSRAFFSSNNNAGGLLVASLRSLSQTVKRQPAIKPLVLFGAGFMLSKTLLQSSLLASDRDSAEQQQQQLEDESEEEDGSNVQKKDDKPVVTSAMVGTIGIYKNFISPLLPPACRFLPTCSQYGVQAIEEFGPTKGVVLTAWRLLRCSPFGGKGYDPPKWPPVPYNYGSY
eukprot:scaffold4150_cov117-Cylindrotheca_fusiformis.AAC.2